jgi:hypothetical protein
LQVLRLYFFLLAECLALLDVIRQYPKEVLASAGLKRFAASEPPYMKGHFGPSFPAIHQSQPRSISMSENTTAIEEITTENVSEIPSDMPPEVDPIDEQYTGDCPSISGRSTLTYAIGLHQETGELHLRILCKHRQGHVVRWLGFGQGN